MFRKAYDLAFTRGNIWKGYKKNRDVALFVLKRLLSRPLPKGFDDLNTIVSVDELSKLMNEKGRIAQVEQDQQVM